MTDYLPKKTNTVTSDKGRSSNDLVSLEDATPSPPANSSQDSILNAAQEFEAQLEQMSNWKHQLAQQMEVMRRDGIKVLERQKSLAVEKKRLLEERAGLAADKQQIEALQRELAEETRKLRAKEEEIDGARGELKKLEAERQRWERDLQAAQEATESLEQRREQTAAGLAAAEARLQEIEQITAQRDTLHQQIKAAQAALASIEAEQAAAQTARQDWQLKDADLQAREKSLVDAEARHLQQDLELKSALEQLDEQRRRLMEAQRALLHERESFGNQQHDRAAAFEARETELAAKESALSQQLAEVAARDEGLRAARQEIVDGRAQLAILQKDLQQRERELAERQIGADEELQARLAAAEKARKLAEDDRQILLKQRNDLEKKLDDMEGELTTQLETLAKQTKRLTERRADLETRSTELEKEFETRLARETDALREELTRAQRQYEQRTAALQQQLEQAQSGNTDWQAAETALRAQLEATGQQFLAAKKNLAALAEELAATKREGEAQKQQLTARLEEQLARHERDDTATAQLQQALARLAEAEAAKQQLEAQASVVNTADAQQIEVISRQLVMLEKQRDDMAAQLFTIQDAMRRQTDEALLAKNVLESELIELRRRSSQLEAERTTWQSQRAVAPTPPPSHPDHPGISIDVLRRAEETLLHHRERLLRQARNVRAYRKQVRETRSSLESHREEIAQQREQLRARKENLEQVKRLLEKQEMVMARKLADHNALKTVAAVGIFVIMVLGSVFLGVYKFANPTYRSEAVVQLVPPAGADGTVPQGPALQSWLTQQMAAVRSDEVTFAAWKILRTPDEHYAMQDVREEWVASLAKNLQLQADAGTKTMSIRYSGPNAEGVSQVCNALAVAFSTPAARDGNEQSKAFGAGATVLAKAAPPLYPTEDNRLTMSLSVVAIVLFVSLLLVMLFRYYIARQLREIDQMADEQDLDDIRAEMPADVRPA